MQKFLYEVGHDTGLITYGEAEVRRLLKSGMVRTLLISEELGHAYESPSNAAHAATKNNTPSKPRTCKLSSRASSGKPCPNCKAPSMTIVDKKDVVDDLAQLAELFEH